MVQLVHWLGIIVDFLIFVNDNDYHSMINLLSLKMQRKVTKLFSVNAVLRFFIKVGLFSGLLALYFYSWTLLYG